MGSVSLPHTPPKGPAIFPEQLNGTWWTSHHSQQETKFVLIQISSASAHKLLNTPQKPDTSPVAWGHHKHQIICALQKGAHRKLQLQTYGSASNLKNPHKPTLYTKKELTGGWFLQLIAPDVSYLQQLRGEADHSQTAETKPCPTRPASISYFLRSLF